MAKKRPPKRKPAKKAADTRASQPSTPTQVEQLAPDLAMYHRSLHEELASIKNRMRSLIQHWPTDGAFKEDILKMVLRRHLPESLMVARGFVVTPTEASTEIDILIIERSKATLFKADDLVIVTPDAVRAMIEVKTSLASDNKIRNAITKLATNKRLLFPSHESRHAWTGLFVYEGGDMKHQVLLRALSNAQHRTEMPVNCVTYGANVLATFVDMREAIGAEPQDTHWRTAQTSGFAPSIFLAYLLSHLGATSNPRIWFPEDPNGKWRFALPLGQRRPQELQK